MQQDSDFGPEKHTWTENQEQGAAVRAQEQLGIKGGYDLLLALDPLLGWNHE
jgi:hypothetical protein